jgi:C-terminal processing protease CtpA/Prc
MKIDSSVLASWRTARRITLGAIVIAGTMTTAAAVAQRVAQHPCSRAHVRAQVPVQSVYTYSGIGVELTQDGEDFVVARVFPGSPADGKLYEGAVLLGVDGESPRHMQQWVGMIRGEQGSSVELEVVYPCSGHETVVIERDIVHVRP